MNDDIKLIKTNPESIMTESGSREFFASPTTARMRVRTGASLRLILPHQGTNTLTTPKLDLPTMNPVSKGANT